MGRESKSITVSVSVSRHNSDRDERDDRLVEELHDAIMDLCRHPKFEPISPDVW